VRQRQHGTVSCYQRGPIVGRHSPKGCRCRECASAWSVYNKQLVRRRRRGELIDPLIDAAEAREHLLYLQSRGVGDSWIETATGLSRPTIDRVRNGRNQRIRPSTAQAIMRLGLRHCPHAKLEPGPTRQRIADLKRAGWTQEQVRAVVGDWRKTKGGYVTVRMAERIEELWRKEAS
jgi:hypothetical protein